MLLGVTKLPQESEDIVRESNPQPFAKVTIPSPPLGKSQLKIHLCWPQTQAGLIKMITGEKMVADEI